jgi:hypothetical protein
MWDDLSLLQYPAICDILPDESPINDEEQNLDKEIAYRELFNRFAKPGETLDDDWIDTFDDIIIKEGGVVATHSWESDNPGAGAGTTLIYRFRGLFFTSDDFGINGPYEELSEAAEAVGLLTVTETTERIWKGWPHSPD